jgi:L-Ala-D/L-Glu epimerase
VRRELVRLALPFREPYRTATGELAVRELLLLRLVGEDGVVGHGEAAPLEGYDGVPLAACAAALARGLPGPPQAGAAEELARLDLEARRTGRALCAGERQRVEVNRTLPAAAPERCAELAAAGARGGYRCFKVKVGLPDDLDRVAAVRAAIGPEPALRLDANGAWGVEEAVARLRELEPHGLELVEQPCRTLAELVEVRSRAGVRVAADESIATAADVAEAAGLGACDAVCVKLQASGGLAGARAAIRGAREHGLDAYLASTLDGPWGIAAALQLASAEGVGLACGLATLELFDSPLAAALPAPERGSMAVPRGPGAGVEVDGAALAAATVERLELI